MPTSRDADPYYSFTIQTPAARRRSVRKARVRQLGVLAALAVAIAAPSPSIHLSHPPRPSTSPAIATEKVR